MGYMKGIDRSQLMLPTSLEEWVSEEPFLLCSGHIGSFVSFQKVLSP